MNPIRLIAIDLDGTLLNSASEVSVANAAALRDAVDRGIMVCLATGKPYAAIRPLVDCFGLASPQIALNGGLVVHPDGKTALLQRYLERDDAECICRALWREEIAFVCYQQERSVTDAAYPELEHLLRIGEPQPVVFANALFEEPLFKILTFTGVEQSAAEARLKSLCPPRVLSVRTSPVLYEFIPRKSGKGQALQALAQMLGLEREEMAAIGDSENDASMLEVVGLPIAMGNATPSIERLAVRQVADNDHDGVAEALALIGGR